eukprot:8881152-Alexandrium_andersonii.AAC.1
MPWTQWCHQRAASVHLPGGRVHHVDRGSEQGDPLGGAYCAFVLDDVAAKARTAVEEAGGWLFDV